MKNFILFASLFVVSTTLFAQTDCGDPQALNYNPTTPEYGHNCSYSATAIVPSQVVELADVPETSGIIFFDGKLFTHNDSGGEPELYSIDLSTGETIQVIRLIGLTADSISDWEALTHNETHIFIGDFGNNNGTRQNLRVYKIAKSDITEADTAMVNYEVIPFFYPEQNSFESSQDHNFDCEGFIAKSDSLFLFLKHRGDLNTALYSIPNTAQTEPFSAIKKREFNSGGQITGATYYPERNVVALIGYINLANPFVYLLWDYQGNDFFSGYTRRLELPNAASGQVEAITYFDNNTIYISNENLGVPARISEFKDTYTFDAILSISELQATPPLVVNGDYLHALFSEPATILAFDSTGKQVLNTKISNQHPIYIGQFKKGNYVFHTNKQGAIFTQKVHIE